MISILLWYFNRWDHVTLCRDCWYRVLKSCCYSISSEVQVSMPQYATNGWSSRHMSINKPLMCTRYDRIVPGSWYMATACYSTMVAVTDQVWRSRCWSQNGWAKRPAQLSHDWGSHWPLNDFLVRLDKILSDILCNINIILEKITRDG